MEVVIFIGIPASGKSTYFASTYAETHVSISQDVVKTRQKEDALLSLCFALKLKVVIDNTNVTVKRRAHYIRMAKAYGYKVIGVFFASTLETATARNAKREKPVDQRGLAAKHKSLVVPTIEEGFDTLYSTGEWITSNMRTK
jgi:predicted kinase